MRAFAVQKFGDAAGLVDLPIPEADKEYLIRVTYAGVNPVDYKMVDRLKADSPFPYIVGADFAGVVQKAPRGEGFFKPGERVFGMARKHGAYAEFTSVPTNDPSQPITRISDEISDQQAAALPIPAITAFGSIDWLKISQGQSLIIFGATGAVGGYAVQLARAAGATVIAVVRGDDEEARLLGADQVYNSGDQNFVALVRDAYPDGVDAILDLVNGPDQIRADIELIKEGGRLVSTIYAADEQWFTEHHVTALNIAGQTNPFSTPDGLTEVERLLINGTLTARIQLVADLNSASETIEKLKKGGIHGKVLLKI